jgi:hypothetical protein
MDYITKFLNNIAYKFNKGYPDMKNSQDILLLEQLISEVLGEKFSLINESIKTNTSKAIQFLVNNTDKGFKTQTDPQRLGNLNKVSEEDILNIFKNKLGAKNIITHSPKTGPNPSSKFNMYEFDTEEFGKVAIIVSGGANLGEKYEKDFVFKAKNLAGVPNNELPNDLQELYKVLNIDNTKLSSNDIKFAGNKDTKRSISLEGPKNVGNTIADIIITYDNKDYFISLKNKSGGGIYSGGVIPFIKYEGDKVIYDSSIPIEPLIKEFNIDWNKVADGLNNYINKEGSPSSWESIKINQDIFLNILASSIGYGYFYVKEVSKEKLKIIPLLTKEDAYKLAGDITKTEIKYPGTNTKNTELDIYVNSPIEGNIKYKIGLRNTQGNILPLFLRITKH